MNIFDMPISYEINTYTHAHTKKKCDSDSLLIFPLTEECSEITQTSTTIAGLSDKVLIRHKVCTDF